MEESKEFQRYTLENGVRLLVAPLPHLHSVEMICYVGVGSRYETDESAGISHFLEHMLFRGNQSYPSGALIEQAFEDIGGSVNAATDIDTTSYYATVHPDFVTKATQLFAELIRRPLFNGLETERSIVLEEALSDFNEQGADVCPDNLMGRMMWGDHPLALPVIGFPHTIRQLSVDDLRRWHQRYYTPTNLVICVAGPVDCQQVAADVEQAWGDWQGGKVALAEAFDLAQIEAGPRCCWVRDSDSQLSLQLAWRSEGRHSETSLGLRVLRRLLGDGGACRLMQSLREESGLTYSVDSSLEEYAECGCFSIDLATEPEKLVAVVKTLLHEVERAHQPVGDAELARVIRTGLHRLHFSRDNVEELAVRYGWGEIGDDMRTIDDDARNWQLVTAQRVDQAAWRCLRPEQMYFVCVGPWREEDRQEVERLLGCVMTGPAPVQQA
ncbi:MAG: insulinase family protein [Desulfuromonas sp.]|nr:insulinase family protein [Desulfuromonas sp.]